MKNEIILDGFLREDAKVFGKLITFNFNMRTHSVKQADGSYKNAYSSFKVNYFGEQSEELKKYLIDKNPVRVIGKIDTEVYQNKQGRKIYTTVINASEIRKISFEKQMKDGKEISVVLEDKLV